MITPYLSFPVGPTTLSILPSRSAQVSRSLEYSWEHGLPGSMITYCLNLDISKMEMIGNFDSDNVDEP